MQIIGQDLMPTWLNSQVLQENWVKFYFPIRFLKSNDAKARTLVAQFRLFLFGYGIVSLLRNADSNPMLRSIESQFFFYDRDG